MAHELSDQTIAFLVVPSGVEQVELTRPWQAVTDAGGTAELVSTIDGAVQAFDGLDKAATFAVDANLGSVTADDYDALVLPGGVANPDFLRTDPSAVAFARDFFEAGKPVAVICHGPWTLVEADVVRGRRLTSWPSLQTDIRNAGGEWVDDEVVVCTNGPNVLVSSRRPSDLDSFCETLVDQFA